MTQMDVTAVVPAATASLADPEQFLPPPARPAGPDRWAVEFAVGPFRHEAVVRLGPVWRTDGRTGRPIHWVASVADHDMLPYESLMPTVHGMLVLEGDTVGLHVRYVPVGGVLGRILDPVLRPVARSSVRRFLRGVAGRLNTTQPVAAGDA